jgi:gamma-glutamyltranspeptidase
MDVASDNFKNYPNFKETFFIDVSTPLKGEVFINPDLAITL